MLDKLQRKDFETLIGTTVPFTMAGEPTTARIAEVRALENPTPRVEPFAVVFVVPASANTGQGMCCIDHPEHGAAELFVVPIARDANGVSYEAIFN